ncbi:hypothetical protein [uncultured Devosia sp.]|uniref:hypothetical protein n=1 Tax=uncultured Devosia sp. TaxID=211434 RepID=UPI002638BCE8|nr:hypothetical protein [uncultured Devosia sp.]
MANVLVAVLSGLMARILRKLPFVGYWFVALAASSMLLQGGSVKAQTPNPYEGFLVHCATLYYMASEALALDGKDYVYIIYRAKFDVIVEEISKKFDSYEDADARISEELQSRVNWLGPFIEESPATVVGLLDTCDRSATIRALVDESWP